MPGFSNNPKSSRESIFHRDVLRALQHARKFVVIEIILWL